MPMIEPDLSEVSTLGRIEPGTYPAKISKVEAKTAKSSGNPMLETTFEVSVDDGPPRTRKSYLVITGQGAFNFEQLLRSTGFNEYADSLKNGQKMPFDSDNLLGQKLNVVIDSEAYNGELRDKIKSFLPA